MTEQRRLKLANEQDRSFRFRIIGLPKSKGSLQAYIQDTPEGPRARLVEKRSGPARKALRDWRMACARVFRQSSMFSNHFGPLKGKYLRPVRVDVQFHLPRPKSAPKYAEYPTTYPDLDKLLRVVLDELTDYLTHDDRQIVDIHTSKIYADPPGAIVTVYAGAAPEKVNW